jgi:DNA polymerase I-like protein with 3'-5' exonuclease and polymerase domains
MILAIDTETTGLDRHHGCRPFLVTGCDGRTNYYFEGKVNPYNRMEVDWPKSELDELQGLLEESTVLVLHNGKFDLHMLESIGIDLTNLWEKIEDTLLASHCLVSGESHALKYLAFKYMDYDNEDEQLLEIAVKQARLTHKDYDLAKEGHPTFPGMSGAKVSWWKQDYWLCPEECKKYGLGDVERTWGLWQIFDEALTNLQLKEQYATRKKLIRIAFDMEKVGYYMYADEVKKEIAYLTDRREALARQIQKEAKIGGSFDPNKEEDLRFFLFQALQLKPLMFTEKKGTPSMSKDAIKLLIETHPDVKPLQLLKEYRIAGTQIGYLSSYLKWVCPDNRIRANVFITGTRNTRQAYRDPNLQNIDKRLSHVFGPPPGYVWIDFDLVSIEPRIWAYLTGNKELIQVLESGGSPHIFFSELLLPDLLNNYGVDAFKELPQYKNVKAGGLAIMYGAQGPKADATYQLAGAYDKIVTRMPELPRFNQECTNEVYWNLENEHQPYVTCLGGYRLDVPVDEIFVAPNYKIQGTAGWIIGEAMINVKNNPDYIRTGSEMVVQVHDSIKIEVPEQHLTQQLIDSLQESIEAAGLKYLPTCKASYHIIHNEQAPF